MTCIIYNSGNCHGLIMYKKGVIDVSNEFDLEEKMSQSSHKLIENYCNGTGEHDGDTCKFLEWYMENFWGKKRCK